MVCLLHIVTISAVQTRSLTPYALSLKSITCTITTMEVNIANNTPFSSLCILDLVKANVNDDSILFHHVSSDQAWNPSGNNQNISVLCE